MNALALLHCLILRQLNFAHNLAEKLYMKKVDSFFILIAGIVLSLSYVYVYSLSSLDYFETNLVLKDKYERNLKLISLNNELKQLKSVKKREPATIRADIKNSDFDHLLEPAQLAKQLYFVAKDSCTDVQKEMQCLADIDILVTQFPESIWAGESLVLLSQVYYRNKRFEQVQDLLAILKVEFSSFSTIQAKINFLEKQVL